MTTAIRKPWLAILRKFSAGWRKTLLMRLKNSGVVTSDRKSDAASAGGPNAQPQFRLFSGVGRDEGTAGERY